MAILKIFLLLGWLVMPAVSRRAVSKLRYNWPQFFFSDIAKPTWRAQFNIDYLIQLFLFAAWVMWRETSRLAGVLCAFIASFSALRSAFRICWRRFAGPDPIRVEFCWVNMPGRRRPTLARESATARPH